MPNAEPLPHPEPSCATPVAPLIPVAPRLYQQVADRMAQLIGSGAFLPGQKLPSVRETARQQGVSISTALHAFAQLETMGLVQARPKAGYFVRRLRLSMAQPRVSAPPPRSFSLDGRSRSNLFQQLLQTGDQASFAGYVPNDSGLFDADRLRVALSRAVRTHRHSLASYNVADQGTPALRQAVARRALALGCTLDAQDIVITASCSQAISFCLRAVTRPGDVVALESPTFFGYFDLLESLGLRALEIPTHPRTGMSLPALTLALDTQPVKAVLVTPTLSNPMGSVMPLVAKESLVRLLAARGIPLIEDVVFNDLMPSDQSRKAAKAFDTDGHVMVCGSFAKTVSPGLRLGWVAAGRWHRDVAACKSRECAATSVIQEQALADLLTQGSYEAHLRRLRTRLQDRLGLARQLVAQHFPVGTRVSQPPSGYTLWVELAPGTNTRALFDRCLAQGITFAPGAVFSATDRYEHCLRLSLAGRWSPVEHQALATIGRLAQQMVSADAALAAVSPALPPALPPARLAA